MSTADGSTLVTEATASGSTARWELLRALGAALVTPPPANEQIAEALGLPVFSGVDHTDADGVRRLVAAAGDDRVAGPEPGRGRGLGGDYARHLRAFPGPGHPFRIDPERCKDLGRPVAGGQVE